MQMGCLLLVIGLAIAATSLMVASSVVYRDLVSEVNTGMPPERRIRAGDNTKILIVVRQHAGAFPSSRKRALLLTLGLGGIVSFLAFAFLAVMCFASVK